MQLHIPSVRGVNFLSPDLQSECLPATSGDTRPQSFAKELSLKKGKKRRALVVDDIADVTEML
ncbi:MAG TPA: hypothetical protein VFV61_05905, partial [Pyrinomonadaceae bacterium]|nr:hypothetical protein [Pyrinomonadaceae bacterium]